MKEELPVSINEPSFECFGGFQKIEKWIELLYVYLTQTQCLRRNVIVNDYFYKGLSQNIYSLKKISEKTVW